MSDRSTLIESFLDCAGWQDAARTQIAGDMSARRYFRLTNAAGDTAILMDAPPDLDASTPAFAKITQWLRKGGLSAPEILAAEPDQGLLLLEDFGDDTFLRLIERDPSRQAALTQSALDALIHVHELPIPDLHQPDAAELVNWTRLIDDWYPSVDLPALEAFRSELETILGNTLASPAVVSLRDFHVGNMIWLDDRTGVARVGLLDYQDAFLTHPAYDVASLLTDARIDVSPALRTDMIELFIDRTGHDNDTFRLAFAALSAQRNLRILGIFARLARSGGRNDVVAAIPRVYGYLQEAAEHPVFDGVRDQISRALPPPTSATWSAPS